MTSSNYLFHPKCMVMLAIRKSTMNPLMIYRIYLTAIYFSSEYVIKWRGNQFFEGATPFCLITKKRNMRTPARHPVRILKLGWINYSLKVGIIPQALLIRCGKSISIITVLQKLHTCCKRHLILVSHEAWNCQANARIYTRSTKARGDSFRRHGRRPSSRKFSIGKSTTMDWYHICPHQP